MTAVLNNANYIIRTLEKEGIKYFFMVPGKLINPLMSCFSKEYSHTYAIKPIIAAHEAGAAAMADGYARATGNFGVCMAIDGPGVVNTIPFITAAQADGSSVLLIAGQIPKDFQMMGAIQDTSQSGLSTVDMLKSVCKQCYTISHSKVLPRYLRAAIRGLFGPSRSTSYISFSKDVLLEEAEEEPEKVTKTHNNPRIIDIKSTELFCQDYLKDNRKIVIILGSRAKNQEFYNTIKSFSEKYRIPVAITISSKGIFNEDSDVFLGIFGYSGHKRAHEVILSQEADLILLIGFDVTQWTTLAWHENFIHNNRLIQIDKDSTYLSKFLPIELGIVAHEVEFIEYLSKIANQELEQGIAEREEWLKHIKSIDLYYQNLVDIDNHKMIHPAQIVRLARDYFPKNTIAVADAGVHRSYAAHYWKTYFYNQFFANTTYAPMGWAIPASIGIKMALFENPVIVFTGDGCMLMHGLEIQTAAKLNLDITFIVFNNGYYAASYFNNIYNEECLTKIPQHNWAKVGEGLGLKSWRATSKEELVMAYKEAVSYPGTKLIDVLCDHEARAPSAIYAETLKTHKNM